MSPAAKCISARFHKSLWVRPKQSPRGFSNAMQASTLDTDSLLRNETRCSGQSIMAQSSSVAREPSMEEILASIRRIIEESDTGRPEEAAPQPVNSDVPPRAAIPELPPAVHAGEEAELPPRQGIAVPPAAPRSYSSASERPLTPMRSGPIEREASRPEPLAKAEMVKVPVESIEPASTVDANDALGGDVPEALLSPEVAPESPAEEEFIAEPVDVASDAGSPQADGAMRAPAVQHTKTSEDEEVSMDLQRALEPILSETVERQVSASFEDLSFAVRSEQRRSFDEIAQEIMRPLLQEWLDNNLPTLVERLVREEIERVARGGRR
ncbi:DUF2497 domain-containing protein [Phyllobacterium endophyticum]|uniref:DUF2497 domain-containing protein n=2 Tax=Phyllobacterium endophyticum TaxID=1149773 RepID=A0A2P7AUI5_9HYPH|nr:DUF2497 domain-containing protein [Phyllobacterium endophyticum]